MTNTANIVNVQTGERNQLATVGQTVLHFNPNTGRQIRQVTILGFQGESATVRVFTGPDKGREYPVSLDKLAA